MRCEYENCDNSDEPVIRWGDLEVHESCREEWSDGEYRKHIYLNEIVRQSESPIPDPNWLGEHNPDL